MKQPKVVEQVFRLHGIPVEILSDRGPQFSSQAWKAFCAALGVKPCQSSSYHAQTNGQTGGLNQELEATLRCMPTHDSASWSLFLPWAEYTHNTLTSFATGLSPFEASLGYQLPLFPEHEAELGVPPSSTIDSAAVKPGHKQGKLLSGQWLTNACMPTSITWARQHMLQIKRYGWLQRIFHSRWILASYHHTVMASSLRVHPMFHVCQVKPLGSSPLSTCKQVSLCKILLCYATGFLTSTSLTFLSLCFGDSDYHPSNNDPFFQPHSSSLSLLTASST